jgi:uncharacterized protein (DUF362 family)
MKTNNDHRPGTCHDHRLNFTRRDFLRLGATVAVGAPLAAPWARAWGQQAAAPVRAASKASVGIVSCKTYGPEEVKAALRQSFDLIGGVDSLVRNKTVAVKINLTGGDFKDFLDRPVGETYLTHPATVMALVSLLFGAGAARVRILEAIPARTNLQDGLLKAKWDVDALTALGKVEYENTRNLGEGKDYAKLPVPFGGYMFSALHVNHSYHDTDVMVSLCKLKRHVTNGITLSMKNLFGIQPYALYGSGAGTAGNENATQTLMPVHSPNARVNLPDPKPDVPWRDPYTRVPHATVDICAARPIDLAIVDGITAMTDGEGPWAVRSPSVKVTTPGILIVGRNAVATDAVGTAVMGYDPRAPRMTHPFDKGDNFLLLAEQAGLGSADLAQIEVRGLSIEKARYPYG